MITLCGEVALHGGNVDSFYRFTRDLSACVTFAWATVVIMSAWLTGGKRALKSAHSDEFLILGLRYPDLLKDCITL